MHKIRIAEPNIGKDDIAAVVKTLKENQVSSRAPVVEQFEQAYAKYIGVKHGVGVNSGSSALLLTLIAMDLRGEVIIPDLAYIAVPNAVFHAGLTPVLVDCGLDGNLHAEDIERAITPRTSAIVLVHTFGNACDMDSIVLLAKRYNLKVIEDAAEAHGVEWNGKRLGGFGDAGCFSFFANKTMTTGEGGMVVTNNKELADKIASLRDQCFVRINGLHYWHPDQGYSMCMNAMSAALGISQLKKMDKFLKRKREIKALYTELFRGVRITHALVSHLPGNGLWMNAVQLASRFDRDELMQTFRENNIEVRNYFVPIHQQHKYKQSGRFPMSERLYENGLVLPSGTTLKDSDIRKVVEIIKKHYENKESNNRRIDIGGARGNGKVGGSSGVSNAKGDIG